MLWGGRVVVLGRGRVGVLSGVVCVVGVVVFGLAVVVVVVAVWLGSGLGGLVVVFLRLGGRRGECGGQHFCGVVLDLLVVVVR